MSKHNRTLRHVLAVALLGLASSIAVVAAPTTSIAQNRIFEATFGSRTTYADPFNDVDVDAIFTRGGESWRVPLFWRGGNKWTVRFAPPRPGEYSYHLEATDKNNPDLNGHETQVEMSAYTGANNLLWHGAPKVSSNKRYFEYADGTPFYWLGDTWWTGMSSRLSWDGFQKLTADRKAKGFTVVQIVAGLVPPEETAPIDAGFSNEGGAVWDPEFKQINPQFFDYADRRVQLLIDSEIVPAIVGGWNPIIKQMGVAKLEKHWRYVIARYGAYPVFWIIGGEVYDPPEGPGVDAPKDFPELMRGWTDVGRYIRATDPYHHPVTVHECPPPLDSALQDESVTDFDLFQPSHASWASIGAEIAQLDKHYARTTITKPLVVGEVGYETLGAQQLSDFQRVAFWTGMLNGAAGFTYGANGTWESYTADRPLHRMRWSFVTWDEGMNLPGSYQDGINANLLKTLPWWRFQPHPEWISPHGTTLLEPNNKISGFDIDVMSSILNSSQTDGPAGEWQKHNGTFHLPYCAGIPGEVRVVYIPSFGLIPPSPPTVFGLEPGIRYHVYYWEPTMGIKVDVGTAALPGPGEVVFQDTFKGSSGSEWNDASGKTTTGDGQLLMQGSTLAVRNHAPGADFVVQVSAHNDSDAGLVLRYHDNDNYAAAMYSAKDKNIYVFDRTKGVDGPKLGVTPLATTGSEIQLKAEARGSAVAVSLSDGQYTYASPIVTITNAGAGKVGLVHRDDATQSFANFELRKSPTVEVDTHLERKLYDAKGTYRGEMEGQGMQEMGLEGGWSGYGKNKRILLNEYMPDRLPTSGDWVLVMQQQK